MRGTIRMGENHSKLIYRKIPNISAGLIDIRKHFWGGLYSEGLYWGLIFGGHLCWYMGIKTLTFIGTRDYRHQRCFFRPKSLLSGFKTYLKNVLIIVYPIAIDILSCSRKIQELNLKVAFYLIFRILR